MKELKKKLIEELGIPYYGISSGKLRRYFDVKNFTDPFRVLKGFMEAKKLMKELKPDVVFSKGGFVTVPVVIAASRRKIPTFIHESDMTPGLAKKSVFPLPQRSVVIFRKPFPTCRKIKQFLRERLFVRNFSPEVKKMAWPLPDFLRISLLS